MKLGIDDQGKEFIAFECLNHCSRFEVLLVLPGRVWEVHARDGDTLYVGRGETLMQARLNVIEKWLGLDLPDPAADLPTDGDSAATWQPIETLKRDEMQFVLVTDGDTVRLRLWNPYQNRWEPEPPRIGPLTLADDCHEPTHWMPIPEIPKPQNA